MRKFSEFVKEMDPAFLEGFEKKDDKKEKKADDKGGDKKDGKKLPPWLKGKEKEKCKE